MSEIEDMPYTNHEARWVCSKCSDPVKSGALDFCPLCVLSARDRLHVDLEQAQAALRDAYDPRLHVVQWREKHEEALEKALSRGQSDEA